MRRDSRRPGNPDPHVRLFLVLILSPSGRGWARTPQRLTGRRCEGGLIELVPRDGLRRCEVEDRGLIEVEPHCPEPLPHPVGKVALAREAEARNRWTFMFVAAPLSIEGGAGSPLNPLAIF